MSAADDGGAVDGGSVRDPLDLLAERFLADWRAGRVADVETFAAAHPEHGAALRELLPGLVLLEQMKRDRESSGSGRRRAEVPPLERLGDFRIVRELGRGGMGVVFEAEQEALGRRVALKVLPQASLLGGHQLDRFRREAQIAAQLHHTNIVPVFGSGESDGYHWYAMQFIDGQSLDQWRRTQADGRPSGSGAWRARSRFVARLGVQAAQALHYAHGQGTLHRDVKPANLLLDRDEHLWVTDFGLAKALEAEGLTHSGDVLGTLQYMAPEQFAGQYDARSEVYALGVTLYELLVLRPAFAAPTRSELIERIRTQRPESIRRACADVPDDLAVVVERAIARDPNDRYADAGALASDLQAFLEDRPIAARRQSRARLVVRWCRRNRVLAALAASTLLAVCGAAVVGWVAYGVTGAALSEQREATRVAGLESERAENTLRVALSAFAELFDGVVGRDPILAFEEDPDTGEAAVVARTVVQPHDAELLQAMLKFYDQFAAANGDNQSLRVEAARAYRRVGTIHARLGDLDEAAAAYDQALARLQQITGRDVAREVAAAHLDYGLLEQRRGGSPQAAVAHFRAAQRVLEASPQRDSKPCRYDLAVVHFQLARAPEVRMARPPVRGPRPDGAVRPPDGLPRPPAEDERERQREAAERELELARKLTDGLLAEEPDNPGFRTLQARCLVLAGRPWVRGRERGDRADRERREADLAAGLGILRDLVAKYPANDQYALELCEALLGGARFRIRSDESPAFEEAAALAQRLLDRQPEVREYQDLRLRSGAALGAVLVQRALRAEAEPAARATALAHAESELRAALALEPALRGREDDVMPMVGARTALAVLLAMTDRREAAVAEARALVDLLAAGGQERALPPDRAQLVEDLLQRLGDASLQEAWSKLPLRSRPGVGRRPERGDRPDRPR